MAGEKLTALTELTTVANEDLVYVVDDPSGTPISKKITRANLLAAPGSDTQVIFNDGGALGADAGLVYDKTNDALTIAGADAVRLTLDANASQTANIFEAYGPLAAIRARITNNGDFSNTDGESSAEVFGAAAFASAADATAVGNGANAGLHGVAMGMGASATNDSVAVGEDAIANSSSTICLGHGSRVTSGSAVSIGVDASAAGSSIALGREATSTAGNELLAGSETAPITRVRFGNGGSSATPSSDVALFLTDGSGTNVSGTDLLLSGGRGTGNAAGGITKIRYAPAGVTGTSLNAVADRLVVDSAGITVTGDTCTIGPATDADRVRLIVRANSTAQTNNLAEFYNSAGLLRGRVNEDGEFTNPIGLSAAEAFGDGASATGTGAVAVGNSSVAAQNAVAMGASSDAELSGIAIGNGADSDGVSVVIGGAAQATATAGNEVVIGNGALSVGTGESIVIGVLSRCAGSNNVLVGDEAQANNALADRNVAIGSAASASGAVTGTVSLGADTTATHSTVVLLGREVVSTATNQLVAGSETYPLDDWYGGKGVSSATPTTWTVHGTGGSGTNIAGGDLIIAAGPSTGTGAAGSLLLQAAISDAGAGTTLNDLSTGVEITADATTLLMGFFGATPVAQQTGVTAAVALQNLGLGTSLTAAGTSPGGSDTHVQFNDGGSTFGGDAGLTYNKTNDTLTIGGANALRLRLNANATQSANLFEAYNASSAVRATITAAGNFSNLGGQTAGAIFGSGASVGSVQASAFGFNASAAGHSSVALGMGSTATGTQSISVGILANSLNGSIAIGGNATASGGDVAIGNGATATNANTVVIGKSSTTSGVQCVVVGVSSTAGANCVAIGYQATASGDDGMAFGRSATSTHADSIVFGNSAVSTAINQLVIGSGGQTINDVYVGRGVLHAAPTAVTVNATGGSGTDISGANLNIAGGRPTGAGLGGHIVFQTAAAGATGTTLRSLATVCEITDTGELLFADAKNIQVNATTGTKIGLSSSVKLGLWGVTPVIQPATTGTATGFTAGVGTAVNDDSTFTGGTGAAAYRISDIVLALKQSGIMAAQPTTVYNTTAHAIDWAKG